MAFPDGPLAYAVLFVEPFDLAELPWGERQRRVVGRALDQQLDVDQVRTVVGLLDQQPAPVERPVLRVERDEHPEPAGSAGLEQGARIERPLVPHRAGRGRRGPGSQR